MEHRGGEPGRGGGWVVVEKNKGLDEIPRWSNSNKHVISAVGNSYFWLYPANPCTIIIVSRTMETLYSCTWATSCYNSSGLATTKPTTKSWRDYLKQCRPCWSPGSNQAQHETTAEKGFPDDTLNGSLLCVTRSLFLACTGFLNPQEIIVAMQQWLVLGI